MTTIPVRGIRIKDGKVKLSPVYHDASAAIRAKKSKRVRVTRKGAL